MVVLCNVPFQDSRLVQCAADLLCTYVLQGGVHTNERGVLAVSYELAG
jgi:hypothetical protein